MSRKLSIRKFITKVREGDIKTIRDYIRAYGLPRSGDVYTDYMALQTALSHGHIEIAKLLISEGCRIHPESQRPSEPTPLHFAVLTQNIEMATMLLERNANPYIKTLDDESITTVLHVTVLYKLLDMLKLILTYNVNVNEPDDYGVTALDLLVTCMIEANFSKNIDIFMEMFQLMLSKVATTDSKKLNNSGNSVVQWLIMDNSIRYKMNKNTVEVMRLLMSKGATIDLNKSDKYGNTILHKLLITGSRFAENDDYFAVFQCIPSLNIAVDRQNSVGQTPLHLAAENGQTSIFNVLLPLASSVDVKDIQGNGILHSYLQGLLNPGTNSSDNDSATIEMILKKGAVIEAKNIRGITPVHLAMALKNKDIAIKLLERIDNADLRDNKNRSLLHFLAGVTYVTRSPRYNHKYGILYRYIGSSLPNSTKSPEIAQMILAKNGTVDLMSYEYRFTPLHIAVICRQSDLVQFLLQHGANVNAVNENGDTALHLLIDSLNYELEDVDVRIIDMLIAGGANPEIVNNHKLSVLHIVAHNRKLRTMLVLLKHCCKNAVMLKDQQGNTVLNIILASLRRDATTNIELCLEITNKFLLKAGDCLVNVLNNEMETPLHLAAKHNHYDMILVMLRFCEKVVILKDQNGNTALHIVLKSYSRNAVETKLYVEVVMQFILKAGNCLVNIPNEEGETPLHLAAEQKHYEVMQVLMQSGADPMLCDRHGNTILHFLVRPLCTQSTYAQDIDLQIKMEQMIQNLLLNRCSLVNARNEDGRTPLHIAVCEQKKLNVVFMPRLIRLLLELGADPDAQDLSGDTALHLAGSIHWESSTLTESAKELLKYGANINVLNAREKTVLSNDQFCELKDMLANHALKLREAGLPLVQDNCIAIEYRDLVSSRLCVEELLEMKRYQLSEELTVEDVLHMPVSRLAVYRDNLMLRHLIFESEEFALKFPYYLDLIRANCRKAFVSVVSS